MSSQASNTASEWRRTQYLVVTAHRTSDDAFARAFPTASEKARKSALSRSSGDFCKCTSETLRRIRFKGGRPYRVYTLQEGLDERLSQGCLKDVAVITQIPCRCTLVYDAQVYDRSDPSSRIAIFAIAREKERWRESDWRESDWHTRVDETLESVLDHIAGHPEEYSNPRKIGDELRKLASDIADDSTSARANATDADDTGEHIREGSVADNH